MDLITRVKLFLFYNYYGQDEFGNSFYEQKFFSKKPKRVVKYNGLVEASKIPSEWHSWLHYNEIEPPINNKSKKYIWQKSHLPNLSGTIYAYKPEDKKNITDSSEGYYQSWTPK